MGASDWAGRMVTELAAEFETCEDRNLRLTALVRWFASDPDYQAIETTDRPDEWSMLTDDLPSVLREQPGSTIEERWNHLMDAFEYQDLADGGVYLQPWDDFDTETYDPQVSHTWDPSNH